MSGPSGWRSIQGHSGALESDGATNMAVDMALLESVRAGGAPTLRFYRWTPACLSFGRNQPARGLYDEAQAAALGITFVRRPTGGQAVLHDDEVTYAVAAPVAAVGRPRAAYRRINEALVAGLRGLGVAAQVADAPTAHAGGKPVGARDWGRACFRTPEAGEVVVRGRKLVGSAQRTEGGIILQHGSILVGGSQASAEALRVGGPAAGEESDPSPPSASGDGWTTLCAELGRRPAAAEVTAALAAGFEAAFGISLAPTELTPGESSGALGLRDRFLSAAWTWRR